MKVQEGKLQLFEKEMLYVMLDGELLECKPIVTTFVKEEGGYRAFSTLQLPNGATVDNVEYCDVYDTPSDYTANKTALTSTYSLSHNKWRMFKNVIERNLIKDDTCYTFENGECQAHKISFETFYYDYRVKEWVCPEYREIDKYITYATRELACSFNILKVIDAQGNESEIVGTNKLLELTEEQNELVCQLERTVRQLKAAGVLLVADNCDRYAAFNIKNVEAYDLSYNGCDIPQGEEDQYECVSRFARPFEVDMDYPQWSEDCVLHIKRKK